MASLSAAPAAAAAAASVYLKFSYLSPTRKPYTRQNRQLDIVTLLRSSHGSLPRSNGCAAFVRNRRHVIRSSRPFVCFASALSPELKLTLDKVVKSHKVVLFMKGTRDFPQCGFSNTVVQILKSLNVPFETMDILENEVLRQGLKEYSSWPTFPQLFIDGDFFGGCDITVGRMRITRRPRSPLLPYDPLDKCPRSSL